MNPNTKKVLDAAFLNDVADEIVKARTKFPRNTIQMMALTEEVGELANALIEHRSLVKKADASEDPDAELQRIEASARHVWKEAVQTAAMAMRVAVDGDSSVGEYDPVETGRVRPQ